MSVLAVSGLAREARIAGGAGVETVQAGADPDRLRAALATRGPDGLSAVVSFGLAGGLDPALKPGDLIVGTAIVTDGRHETSPDLAAILSKRLWSLARRPAMADLAGVDRPILTQQAKADLRRRTGAAAVDMESHVTQAFAQRHGLPFAALRVVCDPAERAVPAFAAKALKPDGEPDIRAVVAALLRREAEIATLVRLARDSRAAFAGLRRARALLGFALGIDA